MPADQRTAIDRFDWSSTSLGSRDGWPQSLRTTVDIMLSSRFAMCCGWGPDLILLHNDAYAPILGARHPDALGKPIAEAWPELWSDIEPLIGRAMSGEAMMFEDMHLVMTRNGYDEDTWWTFSYSALRDDDGKIVGFLDVVADGTAKVLNERRLGAANEKLELATRAARLGQFDYWPRTGQLEWDDRCRELFGLPPGAPVSFESAYIAGLHPEDRAAATAAVEAALDPGGSRLFDIEYRTIGIKDGLERYIHAQGIAMFEGDLPVRLVGTVQDVTADRRAQAKLRETEERLRLAARATNDAIWDWDLKRDHVLWNEALESAHGHAPETVSSSGEWWLQHIHPDDRDRIFHSIHEVIDGDGTDWSDQYRFRRSDGSYADVQDRGFVIRDGEGAAVRMIGAMLDDTERKENLRALERAKAGLEVAVEERTRERDQIWQSSPDLLCVATIDGWLKEVNPAWTEALGWTVPELVGSPFIDFIHPEDRERTISALGGLRHGKSIFSFENRYRKRDGGYVWFNWNAVPRGELVYSVVRDVTAAHEQAEALAKAEDQLRQSQKMEAVGQLTGGIAHDFNNMLTGVIGSLDLLKRHLARGQTDRIDRYIDAATVSAQRAAGLTQRLLAFSRRQSLDVQAIDVHRVVIGMEELLRRTLGETIGLELKLDAGNRHAVTDANQLESALLNLAINARDAMPDGGHLTIESAAVHLSGDDDAGYEELEPGDYVVLCVADTGTGMPPDIIAKAFDPFFTTKPLGQGTGLGLSMIYGFIRQAGGQVRIESELGRGTTVKLYLRRHHGAMEEADIEETAPLRGGHGECVMVVEDDAAVRMLVVDVLEGLGYEIVQAVDGRQAMRLLDQAPSLKLLVTDVGLPGMNGRQVAEYAREKIPGLKVLFVTGYAEQAAVRSSFLDAGMDMITKPFAIDDLAAKVRDMIESA